MRIRVAVTVASDEAANAAEQCQSETAGGRSAETETRAAQLVPMSMGLRLVLLGIIVSPKTGFEEENWNEQKQGD